MNYSRCPNCGYPLNNASEERVSKIQEYIRKYPGESKESLYKTMEQKGISSRMTTYLILKSLIKQNKIRVEYDHYHYFTRLYLGPQK